MGGVASLVWVQLLHKNYAALVCMTPVSLETTTFASCVPPVFGPMLPEVSLCSFSVMGCLLFFVCCPQWNTLGVLTCVMYS